MEIKIITPYSTITAELAPHQVRDILHTTIGYSANHAEAPQAEKETEA